MIRGGVEKIHFPKGKPTWIQGDNRERRERERETETFVSSWVRRELRDNGGLAGARLYLLPREDLERAERPRSHERPSR